MAPPRQVAAPPKGSIVGFVFEHQKPRFGLAVDVGGDAHRAGVDFFALVKVAQNAALFKDLGAAGGDVHQSNRAGLGLFAVQLAAGFEIFLIAGLNGAVFDDGFGQMG